MESVDYGHILPFIENDQLKGVKTIDEEGTYPEDPSLSRTRPSGSPNGRSGYDAVKAFQSSMDYAKAVETMDLDGLDRLVEEVRELREANEQQAKNNARLQQDNRRLAGEIARLRAETNQKSSDEYFVKAWDSLKYRISNWAFKHFQVKPKIPRGSAIDSWITDLVRDPVSCLTSDRMRLLLVQSVVWRQLERVVLDQTSVLWAGQNRQALRELSLAIDRVTASECHRIHPRDFQRWRALTAVVLAQATDETSVLEVAEKVADTISSRVQSFSASATEEASAFHQELHQIVLEAIELSRDLDQQRAQFRVIRIEGHRGEESDFWAGTQDLQIESGAGEDKAECYIDLVVVPGLYRFGDLDGGAQDREVIVANCVVECSKFRGKRRDVDLRAAKVQKEKERVVSDKASVRSATLDDHDSQRAPSQHPALKRRATSDDAKPRQGLKEQPKEPTRGIPRKSVPVERQKAVQESSGQRGQNNRQEESKDTRDPGKSSRSFGERAKKLFTPKVTDDEKGSWP